MEKQVTATIVVFLFCLLYTIAIVAQDRSQASSNGNEEAAKAEISRLGFGKRVSVKLKNGRQTHGRITGFVHDHFVVTDSKGTATAIAYSEVFRVSKQKDKLGILSKPWKGIMYTAAGVGTIAVVAMGLFD